MNYHNIYISAGSKYYSRTPSPFSEFQAIPTFLRFTNAVCISIDDYPEYSESIEYGVKFVKRPCQTLETLETILQSYVSELNVSSYSRLFFCNFIHFKLFDTGSLGPANERMMAMEANAIFERLSHQFPRNVYDWGGYNYPKLLFRYADRHLLPPLNPLFIDIIMAKNIDKFVKYSLDITTTRLPPARLRRTVRNKKKWSYYWKRSKKV